MTFKHLFFFFFLSKQRLTYEYGHLGRNTTNRMIVDRTENVKPLLTLIGTGNDALSLDCLSIERNKGKMCVCVCFFWAVNLSKMLSKYGLSVISILSVITTQREGGLGQQGLSKGNYCYIYNIKKQRYLKEFFFFFFSVYNHSILIRLSTKFAFVVLHLGCFPYRFKNTKSSIRINLGLTKQCETPCIKLSDHWMY